MFRSDTGRQLEMLVRSPFFGSSVITALRKELGRERQSIEEERTEKKSCLKRGQKNWKNSLESPSSPGDLFLPSCLTESSSSSIDIRLLRSSESISLN